MMVKEMPDVHAIRWKLLVVVMAALTLITLDNSILYTALPTLTQALGATQSQQLWIINAYPLAMAGLLLGMGTLGDRIGHRRMFLAGLSVFGVASVVAAYAPNADTLIAARALLAVGAAAMMPATIALIRICFTIERERNLALALWGSVAIAGLAAGPVISGALLERFWWGSVFLINVPVALAALAGGIAYAPRIAPQSGKSWDLLSSLQALVALSALVIAIKQSILPGQSWLVPVASLAVAVLATTLFVRRQAVLPQPLLDFALFRNPALMAGVLAAGLSLFAFAGLQLVLTQYYQLVGGFSPIAAGMLVSIAAIGAIPAMLLGGAYLHRIGLRILIVGGLAIAAVGVLATVPQMGGSLSGVIAAVALMGFGSGLTMSVASTAIVTNAPTDQAGMAGSVEEVSFELGGLLAVAILGSLLAGLYSAGLALPASAPEAARDSIAAAMALADRDPANGAELAAAAARAFDAATSTVMLIIAAVLGGGALITGRMLRQYGPGSQSSIYPH